MADKKQKLFRALIDVGRELATITDLDVLLPRILEISREVFLFDNAIIRLLSHDGKALETVASFGYSQEAVEKPISLGQGIMGKAAQYGQPYLINNVSHADDYIPGIEAASSELAVPLIARDRVIGVFNVENQQPEAFTANDCDALSLLAGQAAIAIDNANLYQDLCRVSRERNNLNHLNDKILSSISLGLYTVDRKMRITSWNDSMAKMTHIPAEKALGRKLLETFPTLEKEGIAERLRRVLETGEAVELRLLHRGQAGENRLQKRRLAPLKENGKTHGVVVVVEDITEFEQLLAQTIQSEKLAEVGRMSAGIAHEINNPLAVISYANQILLENGTYTPDQRDLLQRIDNEVERLQGLSTELLSYSAGTQEEKRKPTDINATVEEVLTLMRYELKKKQIGSDVNLTELPLLNIDKNRFKQIFINLILNAVQAMNSGGKIQISTITNNDKSISIHFRDNGPGIPDMLKQRIFEPFFTSRKDGQGTGLGLYLCRKIIAEYGGSLSVANAPGGGSCFEVKLSAKNIVP
ncbi:MAG: ATP-binding protein [Desulfuromusa sp.]|jgi:PAS domain S-box-containing protein|nr:ATP-binding protein [Desulfuromusa sp.]